MNNLFDKEVLKYLKLYIQGNLEYRDKIIIKSIPFVKSYVQDKFASFINQNVMLSYDDLLEVAFIGFIKAIDRYNFKFNLNFYTYATRNMRNEILKYLKNISKKYKSISLEELCENHELVSSTNLENNYITKELIVFLQNNYSILTIKEELIIKYLFGIDGCAYKERELAENFACTIENISKINSPLFGLIAILRKLRNVLIKNAYDINF